MSYPELKKAIANIDAIRIVKESYDYPNHAWETRYAADIGKRKLLNVLRYLANPDRYERPKNRVYRSNRPEVNNLWDVKPGTCRQCGKPCHLNEEYCEVCWLENHPIES